MKSLLRVRQKVGKLLSCYGRNSLLIDSETQMLAIRRLLCINIKTALLIKNLMANLASAHRFGLAWKPNKHSTAIIQTPLGECYSG